MQNTLKLKAVERLNFYGVNTDKLSNKNLFIVNELIITYVTTRNLKTFNGVKRDLLLQVATLNITLNSARLDAVRLKTVGIITPVKVEKVRNPNLDNFQPLNLVKQTSEDKSNSIAEQYKARQADINLKPVEEIKPLCECVVCGEIAMNEKERDYFFNKRLDGNYKLICKGCE